jgi:hypothetical protein
MPIGGKRKLTLTVDNEVVEKAKSIGLNLSEIAESVIRGFAFSPTEGGEAVIYEKYKELFHTMRPLLQKYDVSAVEIGEQHVDDESGEVYITTPFYLDRNGTLIDMGDNEYELKDIPLSDLYSPKDILSNFINELSNAKQKWNDKVEELEMAKRIILAMTERLTPSAPNK